MALRRIIKVEEPLKSKRESDLDTFKIWYEGCDYPHCISRSSYKILMMERQLIEQGASEKLLSDFRDAVSEEAVANYRESFF